MKKTRKAHLWIGLIASILILMESVTGLLMNESWLIGQSQGEGKGNFPQAQMNQGSNSGFNQQNQNLSAGQMQNQQTNSSNGNQMQPGNNNGGQFQGPGGFAGPAGNNNGSAGSFISFIKGLHDGSIGTVDIKWLTDIAALAMIFLTGSGIYLSIKALRADKIRKKRKTQSVIAVESN